jgi:hypothetical protein
MVAGFCPLENRLRNGIMETGASLKIWTVVSLFLLLGCSGNQFVPLQNGVVSIDDSLSAPSTAPSPTVTPTPVLPGATPTPTPPPGAAFRPTMSMLMGANGSPGSGSLGFWNQMGLRFARVEIGPINSTNAADLKAKGYFSTQHDGEILFNTTQGISTMILLAYNSPWNSLRDGDSRGAPKDVNVWKAYIDAVVKRYSAPPYNVKYFQIWNEAAGVLEGGSPQATFFHGPGDLNQPYANAMQDYATLIHIPAAQVIRSYGAYVVYGGWPDQGGINNYTKWLEYVSPTYNSRILDWTDYLDTHYLNINDMDFFYKRYVGTGKIRGVWQTEVGFSYMENHNYMAQKYFQLGDMALRSGWSNRDQFVMMVYHWAGGEGFMLMNQAGVYHDSGTSLKTLTSVMNAPIALFNKSIRASSGADVLALYNGNQIVFQIAAPQGVATLDVDGLTAPSGYSIAYKEAVFGTDLASSIASSSWTGSSLSIRLNVPAPRADMVGRLQNLMGYVILTPK